MHAAGCLLPNAPAAVPVDLLHNGRNERENFDLSQVCREKEGLRDRNFFHIKVLAYTFRYGGFENVQLPLFESIVPV
jgi:hypothetical protein